MEIRVFVDEDVGEWVNAQAHACGIYRAAWMRMKLIEMKRQWDKEHKDDDTN